MKIKWLRNSGQVEMKRMSDEMTDSGVCRVDDDGGDDGVRTMLTRVRKDAYEVCRWIVSRSEGKSLGI